MGSRYGVLMFLYLCSSFTILPVSSHFIPYPFQSFFFFSKYYLNWMSGKYYAFNQKKTTSKNEKTTSKKQKQTTSKKQKI